MTNPDDPSKTDFVADPSEVERRMQSRREFLQPYFDEMALPKAKQDEHYESIRRSIPISMEQESRGVSDAQISNARQARLQIPHHITQEEFNQVLLPSLLHISYMPNPKHVGSQAMYSCASTDWREQRSGKERLMGLCDDVYVSRFIHIAADNYRVLMACEREGIRRVIASFARPVCKDCQKDDSDFLDVAPILALIRAGRYPFAHVLSNEVEDCYLCPGPKLMTCENSMDPAMFNKFMAGVRALQAARERENS